MNEINKLQAAIENDPSDGKLHQNLGIEFYAKGELYQARSAWEQGAVFCPNNLSILNNLAVVLLDLNELKRCVILLKRIISIKPTHLTYNTLGLLHYKNLNYQDAIASFRRSIKLNPEFATAYSNLGVMYQEIGDYDNAEQSYGRALQSDPNKHEVSYKLSELYLLLGYYDRGFELYEYRFKGSGEQQLKASIDKLNTLSADKWDGSYTESLLLMTEQGFGDSLMMMRYLNQLKSRVGKITVYSPKPLNRLFRTFDVEVINDLTQASDQGYTAYFTMMSLPLLLNVNGDSINGNPYLQVSDSFDLGIHSSKPKIGLCWEGSKTNLKDSTRSIPIEFLEPIFQIDEIQLVSLQRGLEVSNANNKVNDCQDFYDTAALINQLDLVIAVDTSVLHLSAALGKESWLLNRATSEWRWGVESDKSVWYDTVKIFRQKNLYEWRQVILDVVLELNKKYPLSDKSLGKLEAYYLLRKDIDSAKLINVLR